MLDNEAPLRSLREAIGLTQEQASERAGVARSALGNAELRGAGMTVRSLADYAAKLGRRLQLVAVEDDE